MIKRISNNYDGKISNKKLDNPPKNRRIVVNSAGNISIVASDGKKTTDYKNIDKVIKRIR